MPVLRPECEYYKIINGVHLQESCVLQEDFVEEGMLGLSGVFFILFV